MEKPDSLEVTEKTLGNNLDRTLITDSEGNQYVVFNDRIIRKKEFLITKGNRDSLKTYNQKKESKSEPSVKFAAAADQQYGFDAYTEQKTALQNDYPELKAGYRPAFKSVASYRTDKVTVNGANEDITYRTEWGVPAVASGNELTIRGGGNADETILYAYSKQDSTETVVGKLNIMSFDEQSKKVYLVSVNGAQLPSETDLQKELNRIYAPAVTKWQVQKVNTIKDIQFVNEHFTHGGSSAIAVYNRDQKTVIKAFEATGKMEKDALYLFFVDNVKGRDDSGDYMGYMPLGYQAGFIYGNPDAVAIAHELGHGAFNLYHTFADNKFIAAKGTTDNLMDYRFEENSIELWAHQWKLVHDPQNVFLKFLQDEEEGEAKKRGVSTFSIGDNIVEEKKTYIYEKYGNEVKFKYETKDTTNITYSLEIKIETTDSIIKYPKENENGNILPNEEKKLLLDSIYQGKYTLSFFVGTTEYKSVYYIRRKKMEITQEQLKSVFTSTDSTTLAIIAQTVNTYSEVFDITTADRMAHFLAQTGYESNGFKASKGESGCYTSTNVNGWNIWFKLTWKEPPFGTDYDSTLNEAIKNTKKLKWTALSCDSTDLTCVVVPSEYICATSNSLKGETLTKKLFSYVYQCEGGNGNSDSEDGYKYRGHGAIQLTWKKTYEAFNTWLKNNYNSKYKDIIANPTIIDTDKELFILSAMWFWKENNINNYADNDDANKITLKINNAGEGKKTRNNYKNQLKNQLK
ncbi:hypothetical protein D0T49_01195 [Paludibacter sp. 221]|nr:hypothetical protein [Paludibacter sp. 221]